MPKVVTIIWVRSSWPKSIAPRITIMPRTDAYGSSRRRHRRQRLGDAGAMGTVDMTGSCDHAAKAWGAHSYDMESSPLLIGARVPFLNTGGVLAPRPRRAELPPVRRVSVGPHPRDTAPRPQPAHRRP